MANVSIWLSLVWIPCVTLVILAVAMKHQGLEHTLLYHALVQAGTIIWFFWCFRKPVKKHYEEISETREAIDAIRKRA